MWLCLLRRPHPDVGRALVENWIERIERTVLLMMPFAASEHCRGLRLRYRLAVVVFGAGVSVEWIGAMVFSLVIVSIIL